MHHLQMSMVREVVRVKDTGEVELTLSNSLPPSLYRNAVSGRVPPRQIELNIRCHRTRSNIETQIRSTSPSAGSSAKRESHKARSSSKGNSRPNSNRIQRLKIAPVSV